MDDWFRLPILVRLVIIAGAWFGYGVLVLDLNSAGTADRLGLTVWVACGVGFYLTLWADLAVHGKFDSIEEFTTYRRALRSGELPEAVDVVQWRRWLRTSLWANAAAAICGSPFLYLGLVSSIDSDAHYHWVPAWSFMSLSAACSIMLVLRAVRLTRLRTDVKKLPPPPARVKVVTPKQKQAEVVPGGLIESRAEAASIEALPEAPTESHAEAAFNASLAERLTIEFAIFFVPTLSILLLVDLQAIVFGGPRTMSLGWAAASAAFIGTAYALLGEGLGLRRNFASFAQYVEYEQAVRRAYLPTDLEPQVWRRRLRYSGRENLRRLIGSCFLVVVGVSSLLTSESPYRWVSASLLELLAMWLLIQWWQMRERLAWLSERVDRLLT